MKLEKKESRLAWKKNVALHSVTMDALTQVVNLLGDMNSYVLRHEADVRCNEDGFRIGGPGNSYSSYLVPASFAKIARRRFDAINAWVFFVWGCQHTLMVQWTLALSMIMAGCLFSGKIVP